MRIPFPVVPRGPFPKLGMLLCGLVALVSAGPANAADPGRGAPHYERHCAHCHGARGAPAWPGAPDLRHADVVMKPDSVLLATLRRGRGVMPGYFGILKEREMLDLLAFVRTLH